MCNVYTILRFSSCDTWERAIREARLGYNPCNAPSKRPSGMLFQSSRLRPGYPPMSDMGYVRKAGVQTATFVEGKHKLRYFLISDLSR